MIKNHPQIIQGGMGIGVSNWRLARAVSKQGQLGVVSGTAIDSVLARRLQLGDLNNDMQRALSHFPFPEMAQRVLDTYLIEGGKSAKEPFKLASMPRLKMKREHIELMIVSNFVEVYLAKEGHSGLVGINYLEKVQLPNLPSLFGAMLAGVDYVLMGAGIPSAIPEVLDKLSRWEDTKLKLSVEGRGQLKDTWFHFSPLSYSQSPQISLERPNFLAIVSSDIVARTLVRKAAGSIEGFVVENHRAGGHNAPPRRFNKSCLGSQSQYSQKDIPNIEKIKKTGLPFWIAGGYASPRRLAQALSQGAHGIQIGTAFALCQESGIVPKIKKQILSQCMNDTIDVITDFKASPTGYPFKVISLKESMSNHHEYQKRKRVCDLGYLRRLYCHDESTIGYRCPGESANHYVAKGGQLDETIGKKCLCNGLLATIGLGQLRDNGVELPLVTAGEDFSEIKNIIEYSTSDYSAKDVIDYVRN